MKFSSISVLALAAAVSAVPVMPSGDEQQVPPQPDNREPQDHHNDEQMPMMHEDLEQAARHARKLVLHHNLGTLSTIQKHGDHEGVPVGQIEYYADCALDDGALALIRVNMSTSFTNVAEGSPASLAIRLGDKAGGWRRQPIDVAAHARLVMYGNFESFEPSDDVKRCFFQRHPDARLWEPGKASGVHDTDWVQFKPTDIYYIGGFGGVHYIGDIPLDKYLDATPPPRHDDDDDNDNGETPPDGPDKKKNKKKHGKKPKKGGNKHDDDDHDEHGDKPRKHWGPPPPDFDHYPPPPPHGGLDHPPPPPPGFDHPPPPPPGGFDHPPPPPGGFDHPPPPPPDFQRPPPPPPFHGENSWRDFDRRPHREWDGKFDGRRQQWDEEREGRRPHWDEDREGRRPHWDEDREDREDHRPHWDDEEFWARRQHHKGENRGDNEEFWGRRQHRKGGKHDEPQSTRSRTKGHGRKHGSDDNVDVARFRPDDGVFGWTSVLKGLFGRL